MEPPNSSAKGVGGRFLDSTIGDFDSPFYFTGRRRSRSSSFATMSRILLSLQRIELTTPLVQYEGDKLLNIGTNRWSFKPELGISKTLGPLILELATEVRFYTDNGDFLNGRTLQVSPVYSFQGDRISRTRPGFGSGSMGFTTPEHGGPSTGEKAKASKTRAWALQSHYRSTGTTRSNSTAAPTCTPRPWPMPTCLGSSGNSVGVEDFNYELIGLREVADAFRVSTDEC